MNKNEALEWINGKRDMCNLIPRLPTDDGIFSVRVEQANAAKMEQAYWVLKSHKEDLLSV